MHSRTPPSSDSPVRPSNSRTRTPAPSSATTSASTTSSARSRTRRLFPIYYESRLAKLDLDETERPHIDPDFEEATEGEEIERKERLKTKWAQLEAIVGAPNRISLVARDIVEHFDQRLEAMDGKAMVVCMSRRICVALHDELRRLRPEWYEEDDGEGNLKVIMTGDASETDWQGHIRNKSRREALGKRFRDSDDPLRVAIVRDMWLTGFDAPSLHTMYVDKPMRGHGLMQAIARVNRVFKDKPGGLVVDYVGLAQDLKHALATYTESGGTGRTAVDKEEAVRVMLEKYEICLGLFYGFDWAKWTTGTAQERLSLLPAAQEHILAQETGKDRCIAAVRELNQAFALAVPHEETIRIRDDLSFFLQVQSVLAKRAPGEVRREEDLDQAVRQIVSRAVASEGVINIFAAAGLEKPDISVLSDEFLDEVQGMPQRNLAVELPREAPQGGGHHPAAKERSSGTVLRGNDRADPPAVPEPHHRCGAGHRGADRNRSGNPRSSRARRSPRAQRRRTRLLRRPRDERQRRRGARRRHPSRDRP